MRRLTTLCGVFLTCGYALTTAEGAVGGSFEAPDYALGSIYGQNSWTSYYGTDTSSGVQITTANPKTGTQAVRIEGSKLQQLDTAFYGLEAAPDFKFGFPDNRPITRITNQVAVRLDGPTASATDENVNTLYSVFDLNYNFVAGMGAAANGQVFAFGSEGGVVTQLPVEVPVALGQYHTEGIALDFVTRTIQYSVNDAVFATVPFDTTFTGNTTLFPDLALYAGDPAAGANYANYTAYFDDYNSLAVPEPAGMAVLLIGGVTGLRRRRAATVI